MNKQEFLTALENRLAGLSQEDINERLSFYGEMIDDRVEDGISEEEAVSMIGSVDFVVDQIMSEIPISRLVKDRVALKKKSGTLPVVLMIILFPVWFPLAVSVFAVLLSLYIVLWILVLCFYIVDLSLALSSFLCIGAIFLYLSKGNPAGAVLSFGALILLSGLAILCFPACNAFAKGVCILTRRILLSIKNRFVGKEVK
ncbi:MAG: DUF1700 domain-containing protein [Lachnospiraceae bacterium]|nr:DUF1700 domain-containing protein [Lachnospiraceae bacterium]